MFNDTQNLENQINQLQGQLQTQIQNIQNQVDGLTKKFSEHQHTGFDGSSTLYDKSIWVKEGFSIGAGKSGITGMENKKDNTYLGVFVTGPETGATVQTVGNATTNMEVVSQHSLSGLSFLYALGGGVEVDCSQRNVSVSTGQTVFTDSSLDLGADNSKVGYYLMLSRYPVNPTDITDYAYKIIGNSKNSITLETGITFTGRIQYYVISKGILLGSGTYPFQKIYTLDGVRFGPGQTGNGQNGLLYMDSTGTLKFKKPDNTEVSLSGYRYWSAGLQFIGTSNTATATVPAGALIVGYWVPQNGLLGTPPAAWVQLYVSGTTLTGVLSTAPGTGNAVTIYVSLLY